MRRLADRLSYRTLGIFAVVVFALAGAVVTRAVPVYLSRDPWFAMQEGTVSTGLFLGLLLAFTGITTSRAWWAPRDRNKR